LKDDVLLKLTPKGL